MTPGLKLPIKLFSNLFFKCKVNVPCFLLAADISYHLVTVFFFTNSFYNPISCGSTKEIILEVLFYKVVKPQNVRLCSLIWKHRINMTGISGHANITAMQDADQCFFLQISGQKCSSTYPMRQSLERR